MSVPKVELKQGDMVTELSTRLVFQIVAIDQSKGLAVCRRFGPKGGEKRKTISLADHQGFAAPPDHPDFRVANFKSPQIFK